MNNNYEVDFIYFKEIQRQYLRKVVECEQLKEELEQLKETIKDLYVTYVDDEE